MAALVPAIHAVRSNHIFQQFGAGREAWIPGTNPGVDGIISERLFTAGR
jgi:hypothetical protein